MQDDEFPRGGSSGNSARGASGEQKSQQQGFFSPASGLALDYHQFVMEAKTIESCALAPIPSTLNFSSVERKDVQTAEEQLNSTSFDVAQTLARQLLGATSNVEINFKVPAFQKNQNNKNEEIVSELKNFGKTPETKMSVSMHSPSAQPPPEKKANGGALFSGFLSKIKSRIRGKKKAQSPSPDEPPVQKQPSQNTASSIQKSISPPKSPLKNFSHTVLPPDFSSLQTDAKNLSAKKLQKKSSKPLVSQRVPPTIPNFSKKHKEPEQIKPVSVQSTPTKVPISQPKPIPIPTPQTKPFRIPAQESQSVQQTPLNQPKTPSIQPPPKINIHQTQDVPIDATPSKAPSISDSSKAPIPKKKKSPAKKVSLPQNYDSYGFDSPLISPKRKTIPHVQGRDIFSSSDDDFPTGGTEQKPTPSKTSSEQQSPPHYPGTDYHSSSMAPIRSLNTNYIVRSQIDKNPVHSTQVQPKTPVPKPASQIKVVSLVKPTKTKKVLKSITGVKLPPKIPPKKVSPIKRRSTPIDELEGIAQDFSKLKRKTKSPAPKKQGEPSPRKYSSSLAKRLGIARRKKASIPKPLPKRSGAKDERLNEIRDEQLDAEGVQEERIPDTSHVPKIFQDDLRDEKMPAGELSSKISNTAKNLLTPKKKVDLQKQIVERQMADELLFAYAKENYKWLYEIYKMGGLSIDEFRSRVNEKMDSDKGSSQRKITPDGGKNPKFSAENAAFSNLSRSADKKFKK